MDFFNNIDIAVFHFINSGLSNKFTDKLMPFITERDNWFIFYFFIWIFLFFKGGRRGKVSAILILILIFISDQISENYIKHFFLRIRPCNELTGVHLLTGCTDSYSFPSNHAVNNFAAAVLFSYFYPGMKYILYICAFIVAVSRVFCGIHYPSDIAGGALIGSIFAIMIIYVWKKFNEKFNIL